MSNLSNKHVTNTLQLLADVAAYQAAKYDELSDSISDTDSDDNYESVTPIYDSFYNQSRSEAIMQLTNFSAKEFQILWTGIMHLIQDLWMRGRLRKSQYSAKDVFFMTLVTMKNGGTWDFLARLFQIKSSTFERVVTKFVRMFSESIFDHLFLNGIVTYSMDKLMSSDQCFKNFPAARYAVDVTFQQSNRPSGGLQEGKKYFSGKHKLYGLKVEISVLPIGLAINCTKHYPGSVADINIFYDNADFHEVALSKSEKDLSNRAFDFCPFRERYPNEWAVLADKGYQGAIDRFRVIHPKRKPKNGSLTLEEERENKKVSSDRIIVFRIIVSFSLFALHILSIFFFMDYMPFKLSSSSFFGITGFSEHLNSLYASSTLFIAFLMSWKCSVAINIISLLSCPRSLALETSCVMIELYTGVGMAAFSRTSMAKF